MLYAIRDTTLYGIAAAIRKKTGDGGLIPVPDMAQKILGISTNGLQGYARLPVVLHALTEKQTIRDYVAVPPVNVPSLVTTVSVVQPVANAITARIVTTPIIITSMEVS